MSESEATTRLNASLGGRYTIERELGVGGMATVYLADDLKHERKVALKVLKPELAAVVGAERFLAEIKTTANLQHPHILPLFDSGEADSFLFYVMPFVEGESLRERLDREKQLPIDEAVHIAGAVASALDYAHRRGVIHRDMKPGNVLLHDGEPVVADFGIALAVSAAGGARLTETGLSLGTPYYMSPERAAGDRQLDARADVYSLAAMLYEMLSGEPPYTGGTAQAILAKVLTERVTPIRQRRDTVPGHIEAALERGLAKLPADRFRSSGDFRDAIQGEGCCRTDGCGSQEAAQDERIRRSCSDRGHRRLLRRSTLHARGDCHWREPAVATPSELRGVGWDAIHISELEFLCARRSLVHDGRVVPGPVLGAGAQRRQSDPGPTRHRGLAAGHRSLVCVDHRMEPG